jgi:hypothetical protein
MALAIPTAWRWPNISGEIHALIRRLANENEDWGAPKIHRDPLKLGFVISEGPLPGTLPGCSAVATRQKLVDLPPEPRRDAGLNYRRVKKCRGLGRVLVEMPTLVSMLR